MCGLLKCSRRGRIWNVVMGVVILGMLSGCGATRGYAGSNPQQTKERDSVIVAVCDEPSTLDPVQGWGHGNTPLIQSTLIRYTSDMYFEKDLAVDY